MNTHEALVKNRIKQEMRDLYKIQLHVGQSCTLKVKQMPIVEICL